MPFRIRFHGIDLLGASAVAGLASAVLWITVVRESGPAKAVAELRRSVAGAREDVAKVRGLRDLKRKEAQDRRAEVKARGHLPELAPTEDFFQALAGLAADHHLRVRGYAPVPTRTYPSLTEQLFTYEASGTMPDLTRFLRAIETMDYWADVSYLKIETSRSSEMEASERNAVITLSLFSAPSKPAPPAPQKG